VVERSWRPADRAGQKESVVHLLVYAGLTPFLVIRGLSHLLDGDHRVSSKEPDLYRRWRTFPFWFNMAPTLKNFNILFLSDELRSWIVNTMTIATGWPSSRPDRGAGGLRAGQAPAARRENIGIAIFMTYLVRNHPVPSALARGGHTRLQDSWWALVLVYPTSTVRSARGS